jgi:cytochrome c553
MRVSTDYTATRIHKRSLADLLVHKFLTEYGYDHGPVIARAIVDDILATVERCYPERVPPKTVVWLAVRREKRGQRKGLDITDLVPVNLLMINESEIKLLTDARLRKDRQARRASNRARFARWCFEAYEQGGVLTQLDLSLLSGLSANYISQALREYETETGEIVPTRGTVHDIGPSVTHKAEVIRRWLRNESPAHIARVLKHSQEAVDRYIADCQKVRTLAQRFAPADLPALTGLSASVVDQYIALIREYEPQLCLYQAPPTLETSDFAANDGTSSEDNERREQEITAGEPALAFLLGSSDYTPQQDYGQKATAHSHSVGH